MNESVQAKRQICIMGLILTNQNKVYEIEDLSEYFGVSVATINRDLNALRMAGFDIHSTAKEGIIITGDIDEEMIRKLLMKYLLYNYVDYFEEHVSLFFQYESAGSTLGTITKLQHAIDKNRVVEIIMRNSFTILPGIRYEPRLIFFRDNMWCLLISDHSEFRIIEIHRIGEIKVTETEFQPIHKSMLLQEINKLTNWKVKSKKIKMKLEFKELDENALPLDLFKVKMLEENEFGNVILEAEIESMDEIAGWIFMQGKNLLTIEPPELSASIFEKLKYIYRIFDVDLLKKYVPERKSSSSSSAQFTRMPFYSEDKMAEYNIELDNIEQIDDNAVFEKSSAYGRFNIRFDFEIFTN